MKAFISLITFLGVSLAVAESQKWYDAEGKLVREIPASPVKEEWTPRWLEPTASADGSFRWTNRRGYVRYATGYRTYLGSPGWPLHYYYAPYRYGMYRHSGYGLRAFYYGSNQWGVSIGQPFYKRR